MRKNVYILTGVILLVALVSTWLYIIQPNYSEPPSSTFISNTETKEIQVSTQTETPGWKTYQNTKYDYEIQYPTSWNIWYVPEVAGRSKGKEDGMGLGTGGVHLVDILVYEEKDDPFIVNLLEMYISGFGAQSKPDIIGSHEKIDVSGEEAMSFKMLYSKSCVNEYVRIERSGYVYWIFAYCENYVGQPHELFPKILSTFKFIEDN